MEVRPRYKQTEVGVVPEDWFVQSLDELGSLKNGINKSGEDFGHGSPFINLMDVFGVPKVAVSTDGFGLVSSTEAEQRTYELLGGDVLFVRSSVKPEGVGLTTLIPVHLPATVFSGFLIRFRDRGQLAPEYKEHCFRLDGFRRRLIANSTVSANTNINQDALKRLQIGFPPNVEEQRAIAAALSDADALLGGLDRLIAKKRDLKQAAMQQLLTGQTRLPSFHGDWEVKTLGDFVEVKKGELITAANAVPGSVLVIAGGKKPAYFHNKANRFGKTVAVSGSGASAGYVSFYKAPIFASDCSTISEDESYSIEFVFYLLRSRQEDIYGAQTGGAQPHVHPNDLRSMSVRVPPLSEQTAIATVLSDMDTELSALEARRDKTRALKQAMMQELLTGRIRLV